MYAALFPGQGAQKVGMASSVLGSESAWFLDEASQILNVDVVELVTEGPEEDLQNTRISQGIILAVSYAIWQEKKRQWGLPVCFAGHSLGQLTAAAAAGVLSFSDALMLAKHRGELMADAYPEGGGMMAVLGLDEGTVVDICRRCQETGWVQPANFNGPGQIILSGTLEALRQAAVLAEEAGARRTVPLRVSGPFHSQLMEDAAQGFGDLLDEVTFHEPSAPLLSNVDGAILDDKEGVRNELRHQITAAVRWTDAVETAKEMGVERFVEFSETAVLGSFTKRIAKGAKISLA